MRLKQVFRGFLIAAILLLLAAQVWLVYKAYVAVSSETSSGVGTLQTFKLLVGHVKYKAFSIAGISILSVLIFFSGLIYDRLTALVVKAAASIKIRLIQFKDEGGMYFLLIPFCAVVYYAVTMPISYDEAWTYNKFSSKGFWNSISYYPLPNNHIFHSIMTNFTVLLPVKTTIAIRVPPVLISLLAGFFLYSFVREFYKASVALIAVALFPVLFMSMYYGYMSRGYSLVCLCFILQCYSLFKITRRPDVVLYWQYFSLAGIMGFFTMPSFLYPYLISNLFILIYLKKLTRNQLLYGVFTAVIVMLLYAPAIYRSGLASIINNRFVAPISRQEVMHDIGIVFYFSLGYISGLPSPVVLFLLIASFAVLLYRRDAKVKFYFLFGIIILPVLLIVQSVLPPPRTFEYYTAVFAIAMGVVLSEIPGIEHFRKYLMVALIAFQLFMVYQFNKRVLYEERYAFATQAQLPNLDNGTKFFIYSDLFDGYLEFDRLSEKKAPYTVETHRKTPVNLDTISSRNFDYYIIDNEINQTQNKIPLYKNEFYSIYK